MILLLIVITIAISVSCEVVSTVIYFIIIRKKLSEFNKEIHFDWLPHKRKMQIVEYKKILGENNSAVRWGAIVVWLYKISWITLIISSLLVLSLVFSQ